MLLIDGILLIFLGFCLVLMTYMVMLMKRLIDDYDIDRKKMNTPTWGLVPPTLAANKEGKKLPPPPPPRPATLDEEVTWE